MRLNLWFHPLHQHLARKEVDLGKRSAMLRKSINGVVICQPPKRLRIEFVHWDMKGRKGKEIVPIVHWMRLRIYQYRNTHEAETKMLDQKKTI